MPSTDPYNVFDLSRIWIIVFTMFLAMLCAMIPTLLIPIAIFLIIVFWLRSTHAYINESYTEHCTKTLLMGLSFFSLISQLAITLVGKKLLGYPPLASFMASFILPVLMYACYQAAKKIKLDTLPYELKNNRISPHTKIRKLNLLWIGAAVGALSVLKPYTDDNDTLLLVLALALSACTLFLVFNGRKDIAALHHLKKQERQFSVRYSFDNLEEIRERRANSWIAKIFTVVHNAVTRGYNRR